MNRRFRTTRRALLPILALAAIAAVPSAASAATVTSGYHPVDFTTSWRSVHITTQSHVNNDYGRITATSSSRKFYGNGGPFHWIRVDLHLRGSDGSFRGTSCHGSYTCRIDGPLRRAGVTYTSHARFCGDFKDNGQGSRCSGWSATPRLG